MVEEKGTPQPTEHSLLIEYQAAQSSAEFHDGLVWSVTNILWAAALVIFGFIVTQHNAAFRIIPKLLLTSLSILGISLVVFARQCALQFNCIKNQKYERCKEIEALLGMAQHTKLEFPRNRQKVIYKVVMFFFIACWLLLVAVIWSVRSGAPCP